MKHNFWILLLTLSSTVFSQTRSGIRSGSPEYTKLQESNAKLAFSITTNKLTYLPGEEIGLTISVKNPTNEDLRVQNPFRSLSFRLRLLNSVHPAKHDYDFVPSIVVPIDTLVTLKAGEERTQTFWSDRSSLPYAAPRDVGKHKLVFEYIAEASFDVVEAELDKAFEFLVPVTRREPSPATRRELPADTYQRVISVRAGRTSRLCLTLGTGPASLEYSRFDERPGGEKRLSELGSFFGTFRCIAESDSPITALEATFSNDGTMLLIGTAADKSTRKLYVDKQNRVMR
jgi:hypothetical protein